MSATALAPIYRRLDVAERTMEQLLRISETAWDSPKFMFGLTDGTIWQEIQQAYKQAKDTQLTAKTLRLIANRLDAAERAMEQVLRPETPPEDPKSSDSSTDAFWHDIERQFHRAYKRVKEQREFSAEALRIQNRIEALWHFSRLVAPTSANAEEIDQSIRYVIGIGNVPTARLAKILWLHWKKGDSLGTRIPFMSAGLRQLREAELLQRSAGTRGDVSKPAAPAADKTDFVQELRRQFETATESIRNEIALALGEWGGQEDAEILRNRLFRDTGDDDQMFKLNLISALTNIGGPLVVETLLKLAETAENALAIAALSSLEFLSSGGSAALTESPEPPSIDSRALWLAYKDLAERLLSLSRSQNAQEYVRHGAAHLLQTIKPALRKMPAA